MTRGKPKDAAAPPPVSPRLQAKQLVADATPVGSSTTSNPAHVKRKPGRPPKALPVPAKGEAVKATGSGDRSPGKITADQALLDESDDDNATTEDEEEYNPSPAKGRGGKKAVTPKKAKAADPPSSAAQEDEAVEQTVESVDTSEQQSMEQVEPQEPVQEAQEMPAVEEPVPVLPVPLDQPVNAMEVVEAAPLPAVDSAVPTECTASTIPTADELAEAELEEDHRTPAKGRKKAVPPKKGKAAGKAAGQSEPVAAEPVQVQEMVQEMVAFVDQPMDVDEQPPAIEQPAVEQPAEPIASLDEEAGPPPMSERLQMRQLKQGNGPVRSSRSSQATMSTESTVSTADDDEEDEDYASPKGKGAGRGRKKVPPPKKAKATTSAAAVADPAVAPIDVVAPSEPFPTQPIPELPVVVEPVSEQAMDVEPAQPAVAEPLAVSAAPAEPVEPVMEPTAELTLEFQTAVAEPLEQLSASAELAAESVAELIPSASEPVTMEAAPEEAIAPATVVAVDDCTMQQDVAPDEPLPVDAPAPILAEEPVPALPAQPLSIANEPLPVSLPAPVSALLSAPRSERLQIKLLSQASGGAVTLDDTPSPKGKKRTPAKARAKSMGSADEDQAAPVADPAPASSLEMDVVVDEPADQAAALSDAAAEEGVSSSDAMTSNELEPVKKVSPRAARRRTAIKEVEAAKESAEDVLPSEQPVEAAPDPVAEPPAPLEGTPVVRTIGKKAQVKRRDTFSSDEGSDDEQAKSKAPAPRISETEARPAKAKAKRGDVKALELIVSPPVEDLLVLADEGKVDDYGRPSRSAKRNAVAAMSNKGKKVEEVVEEPKKRRISKAVQEEKKEESESSSGDEGEPAAKRIERKAVKLIESSQDKPVPVKPTPPPRHPAPLPMAAPAVKTERRRIMKKDAVIDEKDIRSEVWVKEIENKVENCDLLLNSKFRPSDYEEDINELGPAAAAMHNAYRPARPDPPRPGAPQAAQQNGSYLVPVNRREREQEACPYDLEDCDEPSGGLFTRNVLLDAWNTSNTLCSKFITENAHVQQSLQAAGAKEIPVDQALKFWGIRPCPFLEAEIAKQQEAALKVTRAKEFAAQQAAEKEQREKDEQERQREQSRLTAMGPPMPRGQVPAAYWTSAPSAQPPVLTMEVPAPRPPAPPRASSRDRQRDSRRSRSRSRSPNRPRQQQSSRWEQPKDQRDQYPREHDRPEQSKREQSRSPPRSPPKVSSIREKQDRYAAQELAKLRSTDKPPAPPAPVPEPVLPVVMKQWPVRDVTADTAAEPSLAAQYWKEQPTGQELKDAPRPRDSVPAHRLESAPLPVALPVPSPSKYWSESSALPAAPALQVPREPFKAFVPRAVTLKSHSPPRAASRSPPRSPPRSSNAAGYGGAYDHNQQQVHQQQEYPQRHQHEQQHHREQYPQQYPPAQQQSHYQPQHQYPPHQQQRAASSYEPQQPRAYDNRGRDSRGSRERGRDMERARDSRERERERSRYDDRDAYGGHSHGRDRERDRDSRDSRDSRGSRERKKHKRDHKDKDREGYHGSSSKRSRSSDSDRSDSSGHREHKKDKKKHKKHH